MSWYIWVLIGAGAATLVALVLLLLYTLGYIFYKAWEDMRETPKF